MRACRCQLPVLRRIEVGQCPANKLAEETMTTPLTFPVHQEESGSVGFDRRKLIKGAGALAATAVTMTAASAASVTPLGQTGAPTRSTSPLPLGPLSGSRYPDSHLESL